MGASQLPSTLNSPQLPKSPHLASLTGYNSLLTAIRRSDGYALSARLKGTGPDESSVRKKARPGSARSRDGHRSTLTSECPYSLHDPERISIQQKWGRRSLPGTASAELSDSGGVSLWLMLSTQR